MMDLLLKQIGFDPKEIKAQFDNAGEQFKQVIAHFDTRMDKIEHQLNQILAEIDNGEVNKSGRLYPTYGLPAADTAADGS